MANASLDEVEKKKILMACHELMLEKKYNDAMPLLEVVLDDDPNNAIALNMTGYVYLMIHDDVMAYTFLRRAVQLEPNRAPAWSNFALAAQHLGRNEESLQACLKSVEIDPNYALGWTNAAAALVAMSRWNEAEKAAIAAIEINSAERNAQCNLAHVYLAQHKWTEGWKHFELSLGG